jgi:hypothetical protein
MNQSTHWQKNHWIHPRNPYCKTMSTRSSSTRSLLAHCPGTTQTIIELLNPLHKIIIWWTTYEIDAGLRLNLVYSVHQLSNGWKLLVSRALSKVVVLCNVHRSYEDSTMELLSGGDSVPTWVVVARELLNPATSKKMPPGFPFPNSTSPGNVLHDGWSSRRVSVAESREDASDAKTTPSRKEWFSGWGGPFKFDELRFF